MTTEKGKDLYWNQMAKDCETHVSVSGPGRHEIFRIGFASSIGSVAPEEAPRSESDHTLPHDN